MAAEGKLAVAPDQAPPMLKAPVDPAALEHLRLLQGPFWQRMPAYATVGEICDVLAKTWGRYGDQHR